MSKMLLVVGMVFAGLGIYWYLNQKDATENGVSGETGEQEKSVQEEAPIDNVEAYVESLIHTEERFALGNVSDEGLGEDLKVVCDEIIEILPVMNEDFPHAEVTFKLNEMADKIIPAKVGAFVAMDAESQGSRSADFKQDMGKLLSVAKAAAEIVRQTNLSKDERETLLIGIKY